MRFEALVVPPLENNVFIVYEDGEEANSVIIDVAQGALTIDQRIKELGQKASTIVNTHGHADHTIEDDRMRRLTGAKLAIHELDAYRLAMDDEATRELRMTRIPIEPDIQLVDGDIVNYGKNGKLKIIHTPGHTEGSICLYEEDAKVLFSGDTLFARGYGRVDGTGSDPDAMASSLEKLIGRIPADTEVYPGHGRFTTMGEEEGWLKEVLSSS